MAEIIVALRDFDPEAVERLCAKEEIPGEATGLDDFSTLIQEKLRTRKSLRHVVRTEIINYDMPCVLPFLLSTLYWFSSIFTCKWFCCLACCQSRRQNTEAIGRSNMPNLGMEEWHRQIGSLPLIQVKWYGSTDGFTPCKPCVSLPENYQIREPGAQLFESAFTGGVVDEALCQAPPTLTCFGKVCGIGCLLLPLLALPIGVLLGFVLLPVVTGYVFDIVFWFLLFLGLISAIIFLQPLYKACCSSRYRSNTGGTQFVCSLYKKRLGKRYLIKRIALVENASLWKCLWLQIRTTFGGTSVHTALMTNPVWGLFEDFPTDIIAQLWLELAEQAGGRIPRQREVHKL